MGKIEDRHRRPPKRSGDQTVPITKQFNQTVEEVLMATEETKDKVTGVDFTGIGRAWKDTYLEGLEAGIKWQEQTEGVAKGVAEQGLRTTRQWLTQCRNWADISLNQTFGQATNNSFFALFRQGVQTWQAAAEPVIKTGVNACEAVLTSYETAFAVPFRKYVLEVNKQFMDTVIPG